MNLLKEAGLVAGAFGAGELFDLGLDAIRSASLEDPGGGVVTDRGSDNVATDQFKEGTTIRSGRPSSTYDGSNDHDRDLIDERTDRLESYFQAAMSRFLKEQQAATVMPPPDTAPNLGTQDVEMEPAGSPGRDPDLPGWEYDPDDMDVSEPDRAAVASATTGSGGSTMIQRVRISAASDLKEFTGK
ncbi:unnamed protein product [Phytophthora fragariaefolia]|uniref:Unnamed protein product n=1 Tax=Phytophthora fragariaefolia TaxID=1490495 RepID=A0A9W7D336_9STRA|nr:unnamed protein product [Phytophthora fragariaefolia]